MTSELWSRFNKQLLVFIKSKVQDKDQAEDILQNVFIKIHSNIDKTEDFQKIESWIYQITRNTIIDYYKQYKMPIDSLNDIDKPIEDMLYHITVLSL